MPWRSELVPDVGDAFDPLLAYQVGDLLHHRRLVHLIRDLGNDERLALLAHGLGGDPAAHENRAAALVIGRADAGAAQDQAAGGEVRTGHDLDQLVDGDGRILEIGDASVDHLAEIMRRDVGRHADGNAARTVDEEIGEFRGQHDRLALAAVVVRLELDGVVLQVVEQAHGGTGQTHLGIALGRGRIAVDGTEIALTVDQRQAHGEFLREPDQRVVDRLVAVGVIFTHRVAGDARGFVVGALRRVVVLVHREQDAAMHGLQPVAHIGQRARHDHAHGVVEIGALHLVDERDGSDVGGDRTLDVGFVVVGQGRRKPAVRGA